MTKTSYRSKNHIVTELELLRELEVSEIDDELLRGKGSCVYKEFKVPTKTPSRARPPAHAPIASTSLKKNTSDNAKAVNEKVSQPNCDDKPTVEPNAEGLYELNPRMSNILEKELQNIMIKVWQVLPDEAPTEADNVVIDKLRSKAGDDLRNVLGLNATTRLINIHNPLNAKIVFHRRPDGPSVKAFILKYNIRALKKVENQTNCFAIQLKSISDFDRLVTAKDVRCGDVKVTVTSCYKFTQCPDNIKTMYYEKPQVNEKEKFIEGDKTVDKRKELKETENKATAKKTEEANNSVINSKGTENSKILVPNVSSTKSNTNLQVKETSESKAKVIPKTIGKVEIIKDSKPNTSSSNSSNVTSTKVNTSQKVKETPKTSESKAKEIRKTSTVEISKDSKPHTSTVNPNQANKSVNKNVPYKAITQKSLPKVTEKRTMLKTKPKVPLKRKKLDDNDELSDHEILALLSGGIVVDECSGSDGE